MSDSFSAELWHGVAGVYDAILAHPFLTGLTDGTLPHDAFAFYVVQDALYLHGYARALAAVASRATCARRSRSRRKNGMKVRRSRAKVRKASRSGHCNSALSRRQAGSP